jgi:hypothetical protein
VLDHGDFTSSTLLDEVSVARAAARLAELPSEISLSAVTDKLEVDGVNAFVDSYVELLSTVAAKIQRAT